MMQVSYSHPSQVKHSLKADDKELLSLGLDELSDLLAVKKQNLEDLERRACRPSLSSLSPSLLDMVDPGSCFPGVGMSVLPTMETPQPRLVYAGQTSSEIYRKKMMSMQVHCKKQIQELVVKNQFSGKPEGMANNAQTLEPVRKKKKKVSFVLTENDSGYLASNDTTEGRNESAVAVDRFSRAKSYTKEDAGEMGEDGVANGRRKMKGNILEMVGEECGQEGSTVSLSTQQTPQPRLESPQNSTVPSEQSLAPTQPSLVSHQPSLVSHQPRGDMESKTWSRKTVFDMKIFVRQEEGGQFSCTLCNKSFKVCVEIMPMFL